MRISDWSSDVCSSDLLGRARPADRPGTAHDENAILIDRERGIVDAVVIIVRPVEHDRPPLEHTLMTGPREIARAELVRDHRGFEDRSEEHTSELQALMRPPSAAFCLKKKTTIT